MIDLLAKRSISASAKSRKWCERVTLRGWRLVDQQRLRTGRRLRVVEICEQFRRVFNVLNPSGLVRSKRGVNRERVLNVDVLLQNDNETGRDANAFGLPRFRMFLVVERTALRVEHFAEPRIGKWVRIWSATLAGPLSLGHLTGDIFPEVPELRMSPRGRVGNGKTRAAHKCRIRWDPSAKSLIAHGKKCLQGNRCREG